MTKAHLVAACRRSLRLDKHCIDQVAHQILMLEHLFHRMIEAMGCGTLVIAYRGRAVPEVMEQCRTGFIVEGLEDAVDAVRRVPELSWKRCREVFERRFTAARMANDYVQVYERLVNRKQSSALEVCT